MTIKKAGIDPTAPAARKARTPRTYDWNGIATAAMAEPGAWIEYDGFADFEPSRSPIRMYAKRINEGQLLTLAQHGAWEAVAKGRTLFVRFLG